MRKNDYYYVDKTELIHALVKTEPAEITLFTRPHRFGKTFVMSMLASFFDIRRDSKALFEGLKIAEDQKLCELWMNQWPVIFLSFKDAGGETFEDAYGLLQSIISQLYVEHAYLEKCTEIDESYKEIFTRLKRRQGNKTDVQISLRILMRMMQIYYGKQVILLIDEYDVPLAKAFANGYYDQMVFLIRNLLEQALKTNSSLKLAVLTGCMRISKESIFTGLNNFTTFTIADVDFDEYFGFTDQEVRDLLTYYECADKYESIKEWYDGYRFGNVDVYCPWDVVSYLRSLRTNREAIPQNYWINTSSNAEVKEFIRQSKNLTTKREIERLMAGESITKTIHPELTYKEMYESIENIWSVLFATGYLTQSGQVDARKFKLRIPNLEIRDIFKTQIMEYFKESVAKDGDMLGRFCKALKNGEEKKVEDIRNREQ